jgi:uncharacterized protein (DUF924 family)
MSSTVPPTNAATAAPAGHSTVDMVAMQDEILNFWFGQSSGEKLHVPEPNYGLWFGGGAETDRTICDRFGDAVAKAEAGQYRAWLDTPRGALALIILLDQFALNVHRDKPKGYELSASAIAAAYTAVGRGFDRHFDSPHVRMFFYLPLEHSELLVDQQVCVKWHTEGGVDAQWALEHLEIVEKYGRFPGRNVVHGRVSTEAELQYLANGGVY